VTGARIVDDGVGVPLRAQRDVEALALRDLEEGGDGARVEVEVGVDERDPVPARGERADLHGVPLAEVAVVVDHAHVDVAARLQQPLGRPVDGAVGHDHDLHVLRGQRPRRRAPDHRHVLDDLRPAVEHRDDDGQDRTGCRRILGPAVHARREARERHGCDCRSLGRCPGRRAV
jgi:hypothetical protein